MCVNSRMFSPLASLYFPPPSLTIWAHRIEIFVEKCRSWKSLKGIFLYQLALTSQLLFSWPNMPPGHKVNLILSMSQILSRYLMHLRPNYVVYLPSFVASAACYLLNHDESFAFVALFFFGLASRPTSRPTPSFPGGGTQRQHGADVYTDFLPMNSHINHWMINIPVGCVL